MTSNDLSATLRAADRDSRAREARAEKAAIDAEHQSPALIEAARNASVHELLQAVIMAPCRMCKAKPGKPCLLKDGHATAPHMTRIITYLASDPRRHALAEAIPRIGAEMADL